MVGGIEVLMTRHLGLFLFGVLSLVVPAEKRFFGARWPAVAAVATFVMTLSVVVRVQTTQAALADAIFGAIVIALQLARLPRVRRRETERG